jgi:hypothetical protein
MISLQSVSEGFSMLHHAFIKVAPIILLFTGMASSATPIVSILHGTTLTGGAVIVAEVRTRSGGLEQVTVLGSGLDTIPVRPNSTTRIWWVCHSKLDSETIEAFNPGPGGSAPKITLAQYSEAIPLEGGLIIPDTTFSSSPEPIKGIRRYQVRWNQPLAPLSSTWFAADGSIVAAPTSSILADGSSTKKSLGVAPTIAFTKNRKFAQFSLEDLTWSVMGKSNR